MISTCEITLEQLLKAREERAVKQAKLIATYEMPLITFTVNMPGAYKKTPVSGSIFREGYGELMKRLTENGSRLAYRETHDLVTGPEAYIVVNADERIIKEWVLQLEDRHSLGRLFDFDVIGRDGSAVSRETMGYLKRKCLLCDEDAHACVRSRRHPTEELMRKIEDIAHSYFMQESRY